MYFDRLPDRGFMFRLCGPQSSMLGPLGPKMGMFRACGPEMSCLDRVDHGISFLDRVDQKNLVSDQFYRGN